MAKMLLTGNEAFARGAMDAGLSLASSYPGTPSTEILEYLARHFSGHAEWALNEKIALETAIGASWAGRRALCSLKHVGLNVAADPLMTVAYLGVRGGLVVVVADDPGAFSSQNEQDSRFYARFAGLPCLEPADSQEAYDYVRLAFDLSEEFRLPVLVRSVTRVSHACSEVVTGSRRAANDLALTRDPARLIAVPANVNALHRALNERQPQVKSRVAASGLNRLAGAAAGPDRPGVIACGSAANYVREATADFDLFQVGAYPVDEQALAAFTAGRSAVWVLEEGAPLVEEQVRRFCPAARGRLSGDIAREGEIAPEIFRHFLGAAAGAAGLPLPPRPPVMCPGCSHRELYVSLKAAGPAFTTGDIGCYTLGAAPPLAALDTCLCMGAGISNAAGIAAQGVRRVAAVIGDSTFLHSGLPALVSAVYNRANILVLILDNASVAMTGHQPTPLTGVNARGEKTTPVSLESLCRACGVVSVTVVDPFRRQETERLINEKLDADGVNVIISRRPCVLAERRAKGGAAAADRGRCRRAGGEAVAP